MPNFDTDDLVLMKKEVLDGEFGTMRYRLGIDEEQVRSLGGTVAWNKEETDEKG